MTEDGDLRATLKELTAGRHGFRWKFEVDVDNYWWLTCDGHRSQRMPWRPRDEVEVLVAVMVLYHLNDYGPMPLADRHLTAAKQARLTETELRRKLARGAYHLALRLRTGRPMMLQSGDWRGGWKP